MQDKQNEAFEEKISSSPKEVSNEQKKIKTASNKKSSASPKKPSTAAKKKSSTALGTKTASSKKKATPKKPQVKEHVDAKPTEDNTTLVQTDSVDFYSLGDNIDGFSEPKLNLSDEEINQAESDAIASLPHAPSIDSLLFDAPDELEPSETPEENATYESFLTDYRRTIEAALGRSKATEDEQKAEVSNNEVSDYPVNETTEDGQDDLQAPTKESDSDAAPSDYDCSEEAEDDTEQLVIDFGEIPNSEEEATGEDEPSLPLCEPIQPKKYDEKYNPEKPRRIDGIFELVELFVFTLVAVLIVTTFFFRHSVVDGGSMMNTLQHGDHLIITDFLYTPKRGDIIVFEDHAVGATSPFIKRVIGVAGDTVRIEEDGSVYVNDIKLNESYVYEPGGYDSLTVKVGEGELFVLGDHRSDSSDSRKFGVINEESVLGKVILRIYPFSEFGTVE